MLSGSPPWVRETQGPKDSHHCLCLPGQAPEQEPTHPSRSRLSQMTSHWRWCRPPRVHREPPPARQRSGHWVASSLGPRKDPYSRRPWGPDANGETEKAIATDTCSACPWPARWTHGGGTAQAQLKQRRSMILEQSPLPAAGGHRDSGEAGPTQAPAASTTAGWEQAQQPSPHGGRHCLKARFTPTPWAMAGSGPKVRVPLQFLLMHLGGRQGTG